MNPKQIAITGASRLGKTVLWASAKDERVAAVFSVVSGEMGAALIRRDWGETLDDMAQNFPWQFAGNLQKWVGRWNDLPVDQHMLIALSAPRPVYVNGGLTDQWSDPKGRIFVDGRRRPGLSLLGKRDLGATELAAARHAANERRSWLSLSQRRPHGASRRLESVSRFRRSAFQAKCAPVIAAAAWCPNFRRPTFCAGIRGLDVPCPFPPILQPAQR